jgi:predicted nucleic acid-binding protein
MAKTGKKTYYWDTAAFIAWLDGGKGHPTEVIAGLDDIANEVHENRASLCTSVLTQTELLQGMMDGEQINRLQNLLKRRNVVPISVDGRIAQRASEIRNYYNQRGIKISTPDSIHLATAIIYKADEFHTMDGSGKRQRPNDLLRLNGDVAGYPLHIRVPVAVQLSLLAGIAPLAVNDKPQKEGQGDIKENSTPPESSAADISGSGNGHSEDQTRTEANSADPAEPTGESEPKAQVDPEPANSEEDKK